METTRINLCGLWPKEGKDGVFSGKVAEDVNIKAGEYVNMFINENDHEKSPSWNLVIYRNDKEYKSPPTYVKNIAEKLHDDKLEAWKKNADQIKRGSSGLALTDYEKK